MRKVMAWLTALVCVLSLAGCGGQMGTPENPEEYQFCAMVRERTEDHLLLEPIEGSTERNCADKIEVPLADRVSWPIPQAGDLVNVVYDGLIQETYPARIPKPYRVEIIVTDENDTICFHDKVLRKSDLSQETVAWLTWYNGLTEEEQLAISYIPADLHKLCGYGASGDLPAQTG